MAFFGGLPGTAVLTVNVEGRAGHVLAALGDQVDRQDPFAVRIAVGQPWPSVGNAAMSTP